LELLIGCRFWGTRAKWSGRSCGGVDWRRAARVLGVSWALLAGTVLGAASSRAQYLPNYFPTGVPGYDQELGVTVLSRERPLYEQLGIRAGGFVIRPSLDESIGYNSNLLGQTNGPGSWLLETGPSVLVNSDWSRNRLGASLSVDNQHYFNLSSQNQTNWTAALGGGYTIGESELTLAYSHVATHEVPTQIGSLPSQAPIPFTIDDFRTDYTFNLGYLKVTPNAEFSIYRYGNALVQGVPISQAFADVNVLQGGLTFRYGIANESNLLLVLQGIDSHFINPQPNVPTPSSVSMLALAGVDYRPSGVLRYQVLLGAEIRTFSAAQFHSETAPVARANVIWTPTGLTTVTGTLVRAIENPVQAANNGFTYTSGRVQVDHELRRNVVLEGSAQVSNINYFQSGGTQTGFSVGGSVTWLVNRNVRLVGSYQYTKIGGSASSTSVATTPAIGTAPEASLVTGAFAQNLFLLTLHFGI
jgi:hypothetical protein